MNAAIRDRRFPPLKKAELKDMELEISILSGLRPVSRAKDIEVGRHGLLLKKGGAQGLLLPQVATENGWSRDEFLRQLSRKAGLPPGDWNSEGAVIYTFEADVFSEGGAVH